MEQSAIVRKPAQHCLNQLAHRSILWHPLEWRVSGLEAAEQPYIMGGICMWWGGKLRTKLGLYPWTSKCDSSGKCGRVYVHPFWYFLWFSSSQWCCRISFFGVVFLSSAVPFSWCIFAGRVPSCSLIILTHWISQR